MYQDDIKRNESMTTTAHTMTTTMTTTAHTMTTMTTTDHTISTTMTITDHTMTTTMTTTAHTMTTTMTTTAHTMTTTDRTGHTLTGKDCFLRVKYTKGCRVYRMLLIPLLTHFAVLSCF